MVNHEITPWLVYLRKYFFDSLRSEGLLWRGCYKSDNEE